MKVKKSAIGVVAMVAASISVAGLAACGEGGEFSADSNITVVAREDGSGTKSAFMEIIGLKGKADVSGVIIASGTAAVMQEVKDNPYAIAYDSLGYVTDDVKILKVDGVYPTVETIKDGSYKISRPLSVVYKPATIESGANKAFYDFLVSKTAQDIVLDEGYINISATVEYTVQADLSGEINISGSTSLQPLMEKLAAKFEDLQSGVDVNVAGGGSGTGLGNAENGTSDFGMISKEFKVADAPSCVSTEVARDGIAIIVNKKNTLENIALSDLKNIYNCEAGSDQIKVWNRIIK